MPRPLDAEHDARFTLGDGTVITGFSFGAKTSVSGEVVFNTGMVGYPEALTDPSYRGQILVLTYPVIGNYGVPNADEKDEHGLSKYFESDKIQISALIVTDYSYHPSHWTFNKSLSKWLSDNNIPAICGVDTRALTKRIRVKGAMLGKVEFGDDSIDFVDPNARNLVAEVSRKEPQTFGNGRVKIIAIDCGIKNNIIRYLLKFGIELKVVPHDYPIMNDNFDGVFISNGPGDPSMAQATIDNIKLVRTCLYRHIC